MKNSFLILLAVAITILASCSSDDKTKKKDAEAVAAPTYKVVSLESHPIKGSVQLPGVMQPFQFVQIFPKVSGFVKTVPVDRGSQVRQGQVLITLEAPEIQEHVSAAKLQYSQAYASYMTSKDRYERLLETSHTPGTISPYDLDASHAKMQGDSATAQGEYANYKAQQVMQDYLTVTAPFDGVITERNVHPGALVGPGAENAKPMLILQQLSKLRLTVNVPEDYASQIADGEEVHFKVNAIPGKDFLGKISRSAQSLSSNYRSETIEIDVANPHNQFTPGMYAEVVIPVKGSANAFVVPKSAVVTTTEHKYIVADENGRAKLIDVSQGNQSSDSTEIFGDLQDGQQIISNPSYQIKDGQTIKTQ